MNPEFLNAYFQIPNGSGGNLPSEFIIVTAYNPDGRDCPAERNQVFDIDLEALIQRKFLSSWRVIGGSRDFVHAEPGYAIETNLEIGIEIGIQFRQKAIFWVNHDDLYLIDCNSRQQIPIGAWSLRVSESEVRLDTASGS